MVPKRAFELLLMPRFLYSHNVQSIPRGSYPTPDTGCRLGGETNVETALACSGDSIILVIMSLGPSLHTGASTILDDPKLRMTKNRGR